jgi:hypothetical protein
MPIEERQLKDLVSVGPAMLEDFELLGIKTVAQLRRRSPQRMYRNLSRLRRQRIDLCCLDVFASAVAQAKDPYLPIEQRQWWYWSKVRKAGAPNRLQAQRHSEWVERRTVVLVEPID